jgi:hypothetical protein
LSGGIQAGLSYIIGGGSVAQRRQKSVEVEFRDPDADCVRLLLPGLSEGVEQCSGGS